MYIVSEIWSRLPEDVLLWHSSHTLLSDSLLHRVHWDVVVIASNCQVGLWRRGKKCKRDTLHLTGSTEWACSHWQQPLPSAWKCLFRTPENNIVRQQSYWTVPLPIHCKCMKAGMGPVPLVTSGGVGPVCCYADEEGCCIFKIILEEKFNMQNKDLSLIFKAACWCLFNAELGHCSEEKLDTDRCIWTYRVPFHNEYN